MQSLRTGTASVIFAATAPDGKVYKLEHKPSGDGKAAKAPPETSAEKKDKKKITRRRGRPIIDSGPRAYFAVGML